MGHHSVPQAYLKHFRIPFERRPCIWRYDVRTGAHAAAPIKQVEQVRGFYDSAVESELALRIEAPANPVIDKLISQQPISDSERRCLANYIGVMIKRVPFQRQRGKELGKSVVLGYAADIKREFGIMVESGVIGAEPARERLKVIGEIFSRRQDAWIENLVRTPWISREVVSSIETMKWKILRTTGPSFFLTSDNPVCWHRSVGLGTNNSEFLFPLSSSSILHGSAGVRSGTLHFGSAKQDQVRNCNLATVRNSFNAVFYHNDEQWVRRLLAKRRTTPAPLRVG